MLNDSVARAEATLTPLSGDVLARVGQWATEALARATVTEATGDTDVALLWQDTGESVLALLDFLAARAALDVGAQSRL